MAAQQYFDITPAEVAFLKEIASAGVVTGESLAQKLSTSIGGRGYSLPIYDATISSGQLTLPRVAQKFIVKVDTEGQTSTDTLDELLIETGSEWKTGDEIYIVLASSARVVTIENGNNIVLSGGTGSTCVLGTDSSIISLVYSSDAGASGEWIEKYRTPNTNAELTVSNLGFQIESLIVDTGEITMSKTFADVISERSAETLATISFQITAAGTDATHQVYIDEGNGQFIVADVSWTGTPLITTQLTDIVNAINGSGTGYTATDDGVDTYTISAPAGTGATPNASWEGTVNSTSGMTTATTVETFAGGVNGADQDDDINTINTSQSNQFIWIRNTMSANKLTLKDGVDNISIGADLIILPGEIVGLVVISDVVKKVVCCKKKVYATSWVDPNGDDATGLRGVFDYPFATINGALQASSTYDTIIVMPTRTIGAYDERIQANLLVGVSFNFVGNCQIDYTGAVDGGVFDDTTSEITGVFKFDSGNISSSISSITPVINNGASAGTNRCVWNITNASTEAKVFGGFFVAENNRIVNVSDGVIEFTNSHFNSAVTTDEIVKVSGGKVIFNNCTFLTGSGVIATVSGGTIIFNNCRLYNNWNNASGHGISASGGSVVFIGTNRIITSHASSHSLYTAGTISCKNMGLIYTTNNKSGTWNDLISGTPLSITTDSDVE